MTEAEAALRDAVNQAYLAFSEVPRPTKLVASPLRNADKILKNLTAAPLRELTGEQLGPYSGWAITTVGTDIDYRHFLPRIFELAIEEPVWLGTIPPVTASRLNMAGWRNWPDAQKVSVLHFFRSAFWASLEQHPEEGQPANPWLCALMLLGESASLTFEKWLSSVSINAKLQMASFILEERTHLRRRRDIHTAFWEDVGVAIRRDLAEHLMSKATVEFLQSAERQVSEEDRLQILRPALDEIET
jgi:hypothetical protein